MNYLLLMTATAVNRYFCLTKPNVYRRFLKVKPTFVSIIVVTIKQCKSEITSSGHRRDLGLNAPETNRFQTT
ncbi:hypothetical protein P5673_025322 [Acropora cervicornis]|uniref:Uncharacterized protein n=1 Tax=Acropora cervicornis TaxID=6130 RepID=A0AAD9Q226_ACRCE|nr:hypothetical protein P5673_025322 [Acropora cervicornis]